MRACQFTSYGRLPDTVSLASVMGSGANSVIGDRG
jgi:hypothetical protein